MLGDVLSQGVFWVGGAEESLDGEEHCADLQGRAPFVFEDIEADATELVDVGVVDLGQETNLGDGGGVRLRGERLTTGLMALPWGGPWDNRLVGRVPA